MKRGCSAEKKRTLSMFQTHVSSHHLPKNTTETTQVSVVHRPTSSSTRNTLVVQPLQLLHRRTVYSHDVLQVTSWNWLEAGKRNEVDGSKGLIMLKWNYFNINWVIGEIQQYCCELPWKLKLFSVYMVMLKFQLFHLGHVNEVDAENGTWDEQERRKLQKRGRPQLGGGAFSKNKSRNHPRRRRTQDEPPLFVKHMLKKLILMLLLDDRL